MTTDEQRGLLHAIRASLSSALGGLDLYLRRLEGEGAACQVTEALTALGWSDADKRGSWTLVRAWLRQWPDVVRVGQDYWALADHLPQAPAQTRLHVMPVSSKPGHAPAEMGSRPDGAGPELQDARNDG